VLDEDDIFAMKIVETKFFNLDVGVSGEGNEDTNSADGSRHGLPITGKNN
jgi:hypothetical protein